MPRPHFSESPDFQRYKRELHASTSEHATRRVDIVVGSILRAGYTLDESDVPVPITKKLAELTGEQHGMYWDGNRSQKTAEQRALSMLQTQTARDATVESQFIDGLAGAVQSFVADQWRRVNLRWTEAHSLEPGLESARPSFNEVVERVAGTLGYVRLAPNEPSRTGKAS